jgi:hypothetical protein
MAFWFLSVLIVLPIPLIWMVNVDQGSADAILMAQSMTQSKPGVLEDWSQINHVHAEEQRELLYPHES